MCGNRDLQQSGFFHAHLLAQCFASGVEAGVHVAGGVASDTADVRTDASADAPIYEKARCFPTVTAPIAPARVFQAGV